MNLGDSFWCFSTEADIFPLSLNPCRNLTAGPNGGNHLNGLSEMLEPGDLH